MPTSPISIVNEQLRRAMLLHKGAEQSDGELLGRMIDHRDEAALAALVQRHGPMVWGTCRRLLNHHDAEDAFQATFIVLVRKAASVVPREMVGNWLYGVAHRSALQARRTADRRRAREVQVTEMPDTAAGPQDHWPEVQPLLDEELSRLPDNYRAVIVLCDLEGRTRKDVAHQLGCPEGTVAGRLARARAMLAKRLAQRGVTVSGGVLAAVLAQNAASAVVPVAVVSNTIGAATLVAAGQVATAGIVSVEVATLTEGVLKAMLISKLKVVIAIVVALGFLTTGATVLTHRMAAAEGDKPTSVEERVKAYPEPMKEMDQSPLTVTIKPKANPVRTDEPFDVDLHVVNSSKSTQSFQVMNGSWDEHWKSSNAKVSWLGWDCAKNFAVTVKLAPGDRYEKTLPMLLATGKPEEKVPFKMGFTPIGSKQTFWSNEVIVEVEPQEGKQNPARNLEAKAPLPKAKPKEDKDMLQGTWHIVEAQAGGKHQANDTSKDQIWTFTDDTLAINYADGSRHEMTYQMDPMQKPKAIDLFPTNWEKKFTWKGIYEFDGDRLKVSYLRNERPTQFEEIGEERGRRSFVLRRAFTAWGQEVGGLQAGLSLPDGKKKTYSHGETINLVVRVRNVGNKPVKFQYLREYFIETPPAVTDGEGKSIPLPKIDVSGLIHLPVDVNLAPGIEIELTGSQPFYELKLELKPASLDGTGKFQIQYERVFGNTGAGQIKLDPNLSKLATGKLELEIEKVPPKDEKKPEKEAFTAWGQEVGGLQAGLGLAAGEKQTYTQGETINLVVRVRNIGNKAVKFEYVKQFLDENCPTVTDAEGRTLPQSGIDIFGRHGPIEVSLEPGQETVLETRMHGASGTPYEFRPTKGEDKPTSKEWPLVVGTGKINLQYERVIGNSSSGQIKLDPTLSKLATGKLELDIKKVPPKDEKK